MNLKKVSLAAAISALVSTPVLAQQLEEVVVTAQKRAESLQDVPVAVSAFQSNQLENFGIEDTKSLQMVTPSLVFNNRGPIAQPFIRGIGTTLSACCSQHGNHDADQEKPDVLTISHYRIPR